MTVQSTDELIPTRQSLLSRLKNSEDQASWQVFFDTYWRLIYSVAMKSGLTDAEAQDAVQETVIAVAKNIKEFHYNPKKCAFKSWLMLITRQRIIWQLRKRQALPEGGWTRPTTVPSADDRERTATIDNIPDPGSLSLDAFWEADWEKNLMSAALEQVKRQVSGKQFQIFDLAMIKQWSTSRIAKTLSVNPGYVYLVKHRVSARLKREVRKLRRHPCDGWVCLMSL